MRNTMPHRLDAAELIVLARQAAAADDCADCRALRHPGWDSMPGSFDRGRLVCVGTLRDAAIDEPTLQEHHPHGTHGWSADAPIALAYYPYNQCGVWQCRACRRVFLRYTEYGGYYEDERVRPVDPALVLVAGQPEES